MRITSQRLRRMGLCIRRKIRSRRKVIEGRHSRQRIEACRVSMIMADMTPARHEHAMSTIEFGFGVKDKILKAGVVHTFL